MTAFLELANKLVKHNHRKQEVRLSLGKLVKSEELHILKTAEQRNQNLTPRRIVGEVAICDNSGPSLWAIGTRTGENKGIAKLAS